MSTLPLRELHYRAPLGPTLISAVAASAIGLAAALALALSLLNLAHANYFAVASDSMQPAFSRGDLVVTRLPQQLHIGDTVTFRKYGQLVTHRIVALGRAVGTYETRGDANAARDPWTITAADVVGRVDTVIHRAGFPLLLLNDSRGRLLLGNSIAGLVILLWWSWPRATRVPGKLLHPASGYAIP